MIKIAIIDDEQHCIDRILFLLAPYKERVETVCFHTVKEAINGINNCRPALVFLDVQLDDKTGFEVLSSVSTPDFCLIFTTAYEQYAIEAFKFSALDYLLKPIDSQDFENALRKFFDKIETVQFHERVSLLLSNLSQNNMSKRISIPTHEGYIFLEISDILRGQADVNYTHLFTVNGKKYTVSKPLKHFEELLSSYGFFRIHNSHLLNLCYIKAYAKSGYVTLTDRTHLEVSTRRREAFLKVLQTL